MTPDERAHALETTPLFANIHAEAASAGQTTVTEQDMHTDLHFTCFVQAPDPPRTTDIASPNPRRLLELDGRRVGPIDRGVSTNLLKVRITTHGCVRRLTGDVGRGEVREGHVYVADDERPVQHDGAGSRSVIGDARLICMADSENVTTWCCCKITLEGHVGVTIWSRSYH